MSPLSPLKLNISLRPGLLAAGAAGAGVWPGPSANDDLRIVGHALARGDLHAGLVAALQPLGERIAAVEHQPRHFEREQADRRQQHDRDQPEIARASGSCRQGRSMAARARARSAKACAAAATALGSGNGGLGLGRPRGRPRRCAASRASRSSPAVSWRSMLGGRALSAAPAARPSSARLRASSP